MSDLTTLATLERIVERARVRLQKTPWAVSATLALDALAEEIKAEREAKPPHVKA
jgi:hypothetical protein